MSNVRLVPNLNSWQLKLLDYPYWLFSPQTLTSCHDVITFFFLLFKIMFWRHNWEALVSFILNLWTLDNTKKMWRFFLIDENFEVKPTKHTRDLLLEADASCLDWTLPQFRLFFCSQSSWIGQRKRTICSPGSEWGAPGSLSLAFLQSRSSFTKVPRWQTWMQEGFTSAF